MNVLNDVTAAPFLVSFSQLPAVRKDTENGAAVTSLRTLVRSSAFSKCQIDGEDFVNFCGLLRKHEL